MTVVWFSKLSGYQKCLPLARYRTILWRGEIQKGVCTHSVANFFKSQEREDIGATGLFVSKLRKTSPGFKTNQLRRTSSSDPGPVKFQEDKESSNVDDIHSHSHHTSTILQRLHDLEQSFNYRGYSVLRWGLSVIILLGFAVYVFREPLRENVADEVADVASRSLADENVIQKADEVTRAVLQDILHDPEITKLASTFVMQVLQREDVKSAAIQLTQHVLHDPSTLQQIAELARSTLTDLLKNDETRNLLLSYIKSLILDGNTREACKLLLRELVKDPEVKTFMAASLGEVVTSSVVTSSAVELGKTVTHQVVSDATIQQETGNALWDVIKKTLTPGWFGYGSK